MEHINSLAIEATAIYFSIKSIHQSIDTCVIVKLNKFPTQGSKYHQKIYILFLFLCTDSSTDPNNNFLHWCLELANNTSLLYKTVRNMFQDYKL